MNRSSKTMKTLLSGFMLFLLLAASACQQILVESEMALGVGPDTLSEDGRISVTEFLAFDVACADGNTILSEEPLMAGRSEVEIIQDVGETTFQVNATFMPSAYPDSSWVSPGQGMAMSDGSFLVIHGGEGTGQFEDSRMIFTARPTDEVQGELPCEPIGPLVRLEGVIVQTGDSAEIGSDNTIRVTEFVAHDVACADGNTMLSEEPLIAGLSEVEILQEVGENSFRVNSAITPASYSDGTWVSPGEGFAMPDGGFIVMHRGSGTGQLEGGKTIFTARSTDEALGELPCEPIGPLVRLEGVIIQPIDIISDGNLLKNGSFEEDPLSAETRWTIDERGTDLVASWSTEQAKSGEHSLSLRASRDAGEGWPGWFTTVLLEPDQNYVFRVSAYSPPGGAGTWMSLEFLDADGNRIGDENADCWTFGKRPGVDIGKWIELAGYYSTKKDADSKYVRYPDAKQVRIGLRQCLTLTEGETTVLYYDDVYFGIERP